MKTVKSKLILALVMVLTVILAGSVGFTVAYFTDSKQITNVFTSGSVYIDLTEAAVKADANGNLIEDTSAARIDGAAVGESEVTHNYALYGKLFPGQIIHKDPTITNTGSEHAWIAAKIILNDGSGDLYKVLGSADGSSIDLHEILSGGLLDLGAHVGSWNGHTSVRYNDSFAMLQVADRASGVYTFYMFILTDLAPGASVELFDTMAIPDYWGNVEMQELSQLEITVQAFAVQKAGLTDCYAAMCAAFPTHFPFAPNP